MTAIGYFFLISVGILMLMPFVLMFIKANYHLEYLKMIYPDKYGVNYLDTKNIFFNPNFFLLFPTFERLHKLESRVELKKLGDKIGFYCRLIYYSIALLALYLLIWIVFFRQV
jgi:hypothetical protein